MANPRLMFDHSLDAIKGWLPGDFGSLDTEGKLSANVTISHVYEGRVVHKNDDNEFEMGCTGTQMAVFIRQNSDDFDVANDGGDEWQAISSRGTMTGLVATGGTELASTEYDQDQTYHVNDPLRAVASNSNATTGGRLTNQGITLGTNAICAVVSRVPAKNSHKKWVLTFWPVYCPGQTGQ